MQVGFPSTDLTRPFFSAALIELLEAVEAVALYPMILQACGTFPRLLRELEDPDLCLDDFLFSRHRALHERPSDYVLPNAHGSREL